MKVIFVAKLADLIVFGKYEWVNGQLYSNEKLVISNNPKL